MRNHATSHVEPMVLWQRACGGLDLTERGYRHFLSCKECETLAGEITDALDDLEKQLRRRAAKSVLPERANNRPDFQY
jgi:hypothetical protein